MLSEESVPVTGFSPMTEFRSTSTPLIHRLSHPTTPSLTLTPPQSPVGLDRGLLNEMIDGLDLWFLLDPAERERLSLLEVLDTTSSGMGTTT